MIKLNKALFRALMAEHNDTQRTLSSMMGISEQTFSAKLNEKGGAAFNKAEMSFFKKRYNLSATKMDMIFFSN